MHFTFTGFIYNPVALGVEDGLLTMPARSHVVCLSPVSCSAYAELTSAALKLSLLPILQTRLSVRHAYTPTLDLINSYLFFRHNLDVASSQEDLPDPLECGMWHRKSHTYCTDPF